MYCDNCGASVHRDARFCRSCGHPLSSNAATSDPESRPTSQPRPAQGRPGAPRRFRRRWLVTSVLLLVFLGLAGAGFWQYRDAAASTYERGYQSYLQLDCERALREFKLVTGRYQYARGDLVERAKRLSSQCEFIESAVSYRNRGDHERSVGRYRVFLERFPTSAVGAEVERRLAQGYLAWSREELNQVTTSKQLVSALDHLDSALLQSSIRPGFRAQVGREIRKVSRLALRGRDRCQRAERVIALARASVDSAPAQAISRDARQSAPARLLNCAQQAYRARRYQEAIRHLRRLLREFPHAGSTTNAASTLLIDARVASIRRGDTGELPSPQTTGASGSGNATLVIRNDSPETLELLLSGPRSLRTVVPACKHCRKYRDSATNPCGSGLPSRTLTLMPGRYDVVVQSVGGGVDPFSGSWQLDEGYRYGHCFYIVVSRSTPFNLPIPSSRDR